MCFKSFTAAIALTVGCSFGAQANLLANAGFESGLTGWQSTGNADIRIGDPLPYEGVNYVFGRDTAKFTVWQDVDVLVSGYSAIAVDKGNLEVVFGGWQSGWNTQTDAGQITVRMLNDQKVEVSHVSLDSFYSNMTWVEQSGAADILAGTRYLRYEFVGTRHAGSNNDAYLDATYLTIRPVPEPETYALMLAGLIVTGIAAKRRASRINR